jgi:hypothetical protein
MTVKGMSSQSAIIAQDGAIVDKQRTRRKFRQNRGESQNNKVTLVPGPTVTSKQRTKLGKPLQFWHVSTCSAVNGSGKHYGNQIQKSRIRWHIDCLE